MFNFAFTFLIVFSLQAQSENIKKNFTFEGLRGDCIFKVTTSDLNENTQLTNTRAVLASQSNINIFPNPVSESTTISLENDWQGEIQIRLINMLGQEQSNQTIEKSNEQFQLDLDTSQLVQGAYKVIISNGKEIAVASFVKIN